MLVALSACAPRVSLRVPSEAVAELPLERRLTLLDAENEWLAANDAVDVAAASLDEMASLKAQARARREEAQASGNELAVREAALRLDCLDDEAAVRRAALGAAELSLVVAQARFEESRAAEVEAAGLPGARGVRREAFHEQVTRLADALVRAEERVAEIRRRAAATGQRWREARAELTRSTGGAQGSAWVP